MEGDVKVTKLPLLGHREMGRSLYPATQWLGVGRSHFPPHKEKPWMKGETQAMKKDSLFSSA